MGADVLTPQTTIQILRCFSLGRYTAVLDGGELRIRGPQPLDGPRYPQASRHGATSWSPSLRSGPAGCGRRRRGRGFGS
jgi:hypothetical protein